MAQLVHNKRSRYIRITTNALQTYLLHNSPNATLTLVQQTSISLFQFISFLFLTPPLWYYALHFSRGQINWIHNSSICNFAHLYILNLIQVSSMQLKTSTTQVAQYDLYTAMHIEWHSVRRIMQNAQSCNTADSSIRQINQIQQSHQYGRKFNAIYEVAKYSWLVQNPYHNCYRKVQKGRHIPCRYCTLRNVHKSNNVHKSPANTMSLRNVHKFKEKPCI